MLLSQLILLEVLVKTSVIVRLRLEAARFLVLLDQALAYGAFHA